MKFEGLYNGEVVPKLGLGTWGIGGDMSPDYSRDREYTRGLQTAIQLGYTHLDTAEMYAGGHTEELVGRAIQAFERQALFITSKVSPSHLGYEKVLAALEGSLKRLGTPYLDLYLIHWPDERVPLEETFRALNQLVAEKKVRHLGVSNFNLDQLKRAYEISESPLITNQVPYSLHNRNYAHNDVLKFCQDHSLLLTAYTPIEKGRVARDPEINSIAQKYKATPVQVALNWLVCQPGVITIPKSTNTLHLQENLDALEIELSAQDVERLDRI